jgi:DNA-binding transcriptional LysR family regulator
VAPHAIGQQELVVQLAEYLHRHPRVSVEWLLHDRAPEFITDGIDCAIHVGPVDDPSVVALKIAEIPRIVVASPALLAQKPLPQQPADLATLPWLALRTFYRNDITLIHSSGEQRSLELHPRMSTDSLFALRNAALLGVGVGVVSAWAVVDDLAQGKLIHLVPKWHAAPLPIYLLYPYAHYYPAKLRRFVEIVRAALPQDIVPPPSGLG